MEGGGKGGSAIPENDKVRHELKDVEILGSFETRAADSHMHVSKKSLDKVALYTT